MDTPLNLSGETVDLGFMVHDTLKSAVRSWPLYVEPRVSDIRGKIVYCVHICCRECEQSVFNAVKGDGAYIFDQTILESATLGHLLQRHGFNLDGTRDGSEETRGTGISGRDDVPGRRDGGPGPHHRSAD